MCSNLHFSQTRGQNDSRLLLEVIFFGLWPMILIFFTCEIGQQFTNTLDKFNMEFERMNWYLFPIKIQRLLPIVINNVQEPIVIECFGIISGSREQFKKVINNWISIDTIQALFSTIKLIHFIRWWRLCIKVSMCYAKYSNNTFDWN